MHKGLNHPGIYANDELICRSEKALVVKRLRGILIYNSYVRIIIIF